MPIGAIAGATAVAGIGSAVIGSSATKSAAKSAANTSQQATDAQLQLGRESLAQQGQIYERNAALLNPWVQRGNVAGDAYNALLGLPSTSAATGVQHAPVVSQTPVPQAAQQPFRGGHGGGLLAARLAGEPMGLPTIGPQALGSNFGGMFGDIAAVAHGVPAPSGTSTPATPPPSAPAVNALSADQAFHNFADSAGMKFQMEQGTNALNNLYAAKGMLQSGAAKKGLQNYGQQTALQNYFMPYMNMLGGQSAQGAQAGSAVAGVGSNYGNAVANINNSMAGYIGANAANAGNAALAAGAANANMWGNVGSSVGNALGMMGSSYINRGY